VGRGGAKAGHDRYATCTRTLAVPRSSAARCAVADCAARSAGAPVLTLTLTLILTLGLGPEPEPCLTTHPRVPLGGGVWSGTAEASLCGRFDRCLSRLVVIDLAAGRVAAARQRPDAMLPAVRPLWCSCRRTMAGCAGIVTAWSPALAGVREVTGWPNRHERGTRRRRGAMTRALLRARGAPLAGRRSDAGTIRLTGRDAAGLVWCGEMYMACGPTC